MQLQEITRKLEPLNPVSVILYGSRARTDALERSDYEVGALFRKADNVTFSQVRAALDLPGVNVYPFAHEDFLEGRIDTPFQKRIYLRELVVAGKTIYGNKVIEGMAPPQITVSDAIEDLRFNAGYELAAIHPIRNGDKKSAELLFYKSILFGSRDLIMTESGEFPTTYDDILEQSRKLDLGPHQRLVEKAYQIRLGSGEPLEITDIVQGVTYLNDHIEPILREKNRDLIIVKA